ncbi:hypothetical protein LIER_10503 [Lithospermum erythrorhizon]|uniref:DNL-type domain-containing protein n=1 Tax=Lithospermum erythrorhizon TaxID=34254 RepID=A0AAV3PMD3_LITER
MTTITSCSSGGAAFFHRRTSSPAIHHNSNRPFSSFSLIHSVVPKFPRLPISHRQKRLSEHIKKVSILCCTVEENSEAESDSSKQASIDLKLPRRSLLVSFTCNSCGVRSQRFINRVAYERGTVFLQCAGCLQYHKFVDNLGLVVEYNLLEDDVTDSNPN